MVQKTTFEPNNAEVFNCTIPLGSGYRPTEPKSVGVRLYYFGFSFFSYYFGNNKLYYISSLGPTVLLFNSRSS